MLDRIRAEGPALLAPEGMMLVVHSAICDDDVTLSRLADAGLHAEVLIRCTVPFGPVMRARAAMLETRGLVEPGQGDEELVVIGAQRPLLSPSDAQGINQTLQARQAAGTAQ